GGERGGRADPLAPLFDSDPQGSAVGGELSRRYFSEARDQPAGTPRGVGASGCAASPARSAAAPKRSTRPPNATLHAANHAQPRQTPAITSESQCTSRSTRLPATATVIPTAPPARSA